jgi:hypothetical protein
LERGNQYSHSPQDPPRSNPRGGYLDGQKRLRFRRSKKDSPKFTDYALCAETIFDIFPTLKLEEFRLICDRMKTGYYGKYFERLKIQEFRECIIKHEEERAPILERINSHITRGSDSDRVAFQPQSMADLRRKRDPLYIPGLNEPKQSKEET